MTVEINYIQEYQAGTETILAVETVTEITNSVGTFLNIIQDNGSITSVWKKQIENLVIYS